MGYYCLFSRIVVVLFVGMVFILYICFFVNINIFDFVRNFKLIFVFDIMVFKVKMLLFYEGRDYFCLVFVIFLEFVGV